MVERPRCFDHPSMKTIPHALLAAAFMSLPAPLLAQQVERGDRPILQIAGQLKPGEFVWAPELSASGPVLVIVNSGDPAGRSLSQWGADRRIDYLVGQEGP